MGWKTILGAILAGIGAAASGDFTVESIMTGIGIVLGGFGIRHAIAKVERR